LLYEVAPTDKWCWGLWGGSKDGNETSPETAVRELKEELSIEVKEADLLLFATFIATYENGSSKEVSVFSLKDNDAFVYEIHEGADLRFFSEQELETLPLETSAKRMLPKFFESL
jgi:8-oxo-dGTP pyrophosphatase MutT (NUDIX family)